MSCDRLHTPCPGAPPQAGRFTFHVLRAAAGGPCHLTRSHALLSSAALGSTRVARGCGVQPPPDPGVSHHHGKSTPPHRFGSQASFNIRSKVATGLSNASGGCSSTVWEVTHGLKARPAVCQSPYWLTSPAGGKPPASAY